MTNYQKSLVGVFLLVWLWAAYKPLIPSGWLLENYLVFLFVPLIFLVGRYFRLSSVSYTLITIFMILHVIGSHYTYAQVPFGDTLQEWLNADRNMYDRLVHFSFGFLLAYPIREIFMRLAKVKGFWAYYIPIELTLAFSAIYEIVEWLAVEVSSTQVGMDFLGAQGDIWDAQKDMALAGIGAILAMLIVALINWRYNKRFSTELKESLSIPKGDVPLGEDKLKEIMK